MPSAARRTAKGTFIPADARRLCCCARQIRWQLWTARRRCGQRREQADGVVSQLALLVGAAVPDFLGRDDESELEPDSEPDEPELLCLAPASPFDSDAPDPLFDAEPVDPESEEPVDFDPASPELDAVSLAPSDAALSPDLSADGPVEASARLSLR